VLEACERGLELEPDSPGLRTGRGVARALAGDLEGARRDLEAVQAGLGDEERSRRLEWIDALARGANPFTAELLATLRGR
jgi:hypothetical protein